MENCAIGVLCGVADCTLLQPTNYWKNAKQQGLPFTLDARKLYRGYAINTIQNGLCVMSQFFLAGVLKNAITGGIDRPLGKGETIASAIGAGAISSLFAGPAELVMIQQQVKGGGLFSTAGNLISKGPSTVFRGTIGMMYREGLYAGGFLGFIPVVREEVKKRNPGMSNDQARLAATLLAGPIMSIASHPPDTLKTCLQGDIERSRYTTYRQAAKVLISERGISTLWAGAPWRIFRQFCCFMLFDKINTDVAPLLFPHAFAKK
uniref:Mitochondrial carrier protein n=1 Tax=Alexandrium catenella TaxID=2925 RepID=A0A7S1RNB3_ALECA